MNKFWSNRIRGIKSYVPGEQLNDKDIIKLNTNENPYPPSPNAQKALKKTVGAELRLYPETTSESIRAAIGSFYSINPDHVFIGNGSDEILAFSFLAFFGGERPILFNDITYSFYPVYSQFFDVSYEIIPLNDDFTVPVQRFCRPSGGVIFPNPNAPTGIALTLVQVEQIVSADPDRVVIVDEAYVDFGAESAVELLGKYPNLLVVQTASKSRSLAGIRVGWAIGDPGLISALDCVKNCINSYTVDRAAQSAVTAAIEDRKYFEGTCRKIADTRDRTADRLRIIGFQVLDSSANFLFVRHANKNAQTLYGELKDQKILVRHFDKPRIENFLRITVGTDEQMDTLCQALEVCVSY